MQKPVEKGSVVPVRFSKSEVEKIEKAVERLGLKSRRVNLPDEAYTGGCQQPSKVVSASNVNTANV
jgi:hypothetical protein